MTQEVIRLADNPSLKSVKETVLAVLRAGKLVVFPTETVYGIGAMASSSEAVRRLVSAKGRKKGHAVPVAIPGYHVLRSYSPNIDDITARLARRCWPGPITLVADASDPRSRFASLSDDVKEVIMPRGTVGYRVPNHPLFLEILRELDEPLLLTSANLTGEPPAVNAESAKVGLEDWPDLVIDDGTACFQRPSTVVSVADGKINVIREGVYTKDQIQRMTVKMILFVCTGNTCRSPMAEVICANLIARKIGCGVDELESHGYVVMSAGVAAYPGTPASPEAVEVMENRGISLEGHQAQPLSETLLRYADRVYVMGRAHKEAICSQWPDDADRIFFLSADETDICDPLGGGVSVYRDCAKQIEAELEKHFDEIAAF
jgi:protein-tyrosine phosphatase